MARKGLMSMGWWTRGGVLAGIGVAIAGVSLPAAAADGPSLGSARSFAVLGGSTVSSTGLTAVTGDLGVSPGTSITGFGPGTVTGGAIHAGDATAAQAHADAAIGYAFLKGMASIPANNLTGMDLGSKTLAPGVYKFNSSAGLTGALTLDAGGDSGAIFVFQISSTLTTAPGASVTVINGGGNYDESNIYWQVGSSATLGSGTAFQGNILAYASITLVSGATLTGDALALHGAVSMQSNTITSPTPGTSHASGKPSKGRTTLSPPEGGPASNAVGRLDVKHIPANASRLERSWFRLKMRHLDASTAYTLWAHDPATPAIDFAQIASFTTAKSRNFNYTLDTRLGDAMPFGATLADLSGKAVELRDAAGTTTLLAGTIPTTSP